MNENIIWNSFLKWEKLKLLPHLPLPVLGGASCVSDNDK